MIMKLPNYKLIRKCKELQKEGILKLTAFLETQGSLPQDITDEFITDWINRQPPVLLRDSFYEFIEGVGRVPEPYLMGRWIPNRELKDEGVPIFYTSGSSNRTPYETYQVVSKHERGAIVSIIPDNNSKNIRTDSGLICIFKKENVFCWHKERFEDIYMATLKKEYIF